VATASLFSDTRCENRNRMAFILAFGEKNRWSLLPASSDVLVIMMQLQSELSRVQMSSQQAEDWHVS
jgi:hypothetical protein